MSGAVSPALPRTHESWLPVGVLVALLLAFNLFVVLPNRRPALTVSLPEDPVAVLTQQRRVVYAAGALRTGDAIWCDDHGVQVGARVGRPGTTSTASAGSAATISIRARADGSVVASCR